MMTSTAYSRINKYDTVFCSLFPLVSKRSKRLRGLKNVSVSSMYRRGEILSSAYSIFISIKDMSILLSFNSFSSGTWGRTLGAALEGRITRNCSKSEIIGDMFCSHEKCHVYALTDTHTDIYNDLCNIYICTHVYRHICYDMLLYALYAKKI